MNYPVFIYHELVLRFSDINRGIGRYISNTIDNGQCLIKTTSGKISIKLDLLEKQYRDPRTISSEELQQLAVAFESE